MAIKVDMENTFDGMKWALILNVLKKFGFKETWIKQYISTLLFPISSQQ